MIFLITSSCETSLGNMIEKISKYYKIYRFCFEQQENHKNKLQPEDKVYLLIIQNLDTGFLFAEHQRYILESFSPSFYYADDVYQILKDKKHHKSSSYNVRAVFKDF